MKSLFEFDLTEAEWLAATKYNQLQFFRRLQPIALRIFNAVLYLAVAWGWMTLCNYWATRTGQSQVIWLGLLSPLLLFLIGLYQYILNQSRMRRLLPSLGRSAITRYTLELADTGFWLNSEARRVFHAYAGIQAIVQLDGMILLQQDELHKALISGTAFADAQEREAFLTFLNERTAEARQAIGEPATTVTVLGSAAALPVPDAVAPLPGRLSNLRLGLRGLFFRAMPAQNQRVSWGQLFLLAFLSAALNNTFTFAQIGPSGEYYSGAWPSTLFSLPFLLFVSWLAARVARYPERTLALAIGMHAILVPWVLLRWLVLLAGDYALIPYWDEASGEWVRQLFRAWLALACAVCALRLLPLSYGQRGRALVLVALALWLPMNHLNWGQSIWRPDYRAQYEEEEPRANPAMEDIYYRQPELLQAALAKLKPREAGHSNLFFLAAAPYSYQDVFMREALTIKDQFETRFGAQGHALALINNAATLDNYPIASATSLKLSLARMGQLMNKDEDILFLYLTSHGSADHQLSVDFYPMEFNEVNPQVVRKLLDESGIKHRVIVVSACYSGGFIEPLKNANTLVITAAAANKVSFGCSNEADYTYFGKAYFDEALKQTDSFVAAFDLARQAVAKREQKDGYDSSDPQRYIGADIVPVLERWNAQRKQAAAAAGPG